MEGQMIYLITYLLLGVPMATINVIVMRANWTLVVYSWVLWPAWTAIMIHHVITEQRVWYQSRRCGYCRKVLSKDWDVVIGHVQHCEANPLVQENARLRAENKALRKGEREF